MRGTVDTNDEPPMGEHRTHSLLVVDDEPGIGQFIAAAAGSVGYACQVTTTATEFKTALAPGVSLIMLDLVMPDTDGIELLRFLGAQRCEAPIILMSGFDKRVLRVAEDLATELGLKVAACLQKPFRLAQLRELLERYRGFVAAANTRRSAPSSLTVTREDLIRACEHDEFELHYQPQISIETGAVCGAEALVRWRHPDHGLVYPNAFIGLCESWNLIDRLTSSVLNIALADRMRYRDNYGDLTLSVNVSARSLHDLDFPDTVSILASQYDMPPSKVVLEITESGLIGNLARALDVLARVRMKQMRLSIDDFGTGYSMMQQLRRVPATELKVDKSFVQEMLTDDSARTVVRKTIELGHDLEMRVVAEGVETRDQFAALSAGGCDIAQGYLFTRPLPLTAFVAWLDDWGEKRRATDTVLDLVAKQQAPGDEPS